jgi:hypothetical protein
VILAHLANFAHAPLAMLFQDAGAPTVSFSVMGLWTNMGILANRRLHSVHHVDLVAGRHD